MRNRNRFHEKCNSIKSNTWASYVKIKSSLLDLKLLMQIFKKASNFSLFLFVIDCSQNRQHSSEKNVERHFLLCFLVTGNETGNMRVTSGDNKQSLRKVYCTCQLLNKPPCPWAPWTTNSFQKVGQTFPLSLWPRHWQVWYWLAFGNWLSRTCRNPAESGFQTEALFPLKNTNMANETKRIMYQMVPLLVREEKNKLY